MIRRSPSLPLETDRGSFEQHKSVHEPSSRLRAAMGKIAFFRKSIDDIPAQTYTDPQDENKALATYTPDDLARYLTEKAGIDVMCHPDMTCMAVPIQMLRKLAVPEELTILRVSPDNKSAAADFHAVAVQNSLNPYHCPTPYSQGVVSTNRSYYVGYVTKPGQKSAPATTLETLNINGKGDLVRVDNVSTLEQFRGHNYAGVLISDTLNGSQYAVAYLDSTSQAKKTYENLGFISLE